MPKNNKMQYKTCLVTGANSGIGLETARSLADMGARVLMVCRDMTRGQMAVQDVKNTTSGQVELLLADLSSQKQIRDLVVAVQRRCDTLDVLINNAAVWPDKRYETDDSLEMQMAVNHLAPFLLTNLLLENLKRSEDGRVVTVSSKLHNKGRIDLEDLQSRQGKYKPMQVYANSKLANILFTSQLAQKLQGSRVTANCLHPGVVATNLFRQLPGVLTGIFKLFLKSPRDGARTSVYLASEPSLAQQSGEYFVDCKKSETAPQAQDNQMAADLWQHSQELCGLN